MAQVQMQSESQSLGTTDIPKGQTLNKEMIQSIVESDFQVPAEESLRDMTSELMTLLGSTDAYTRENSMEVLWHWGQAGRYSDEQLIEIGQQMADNLGVGLGEAGTDTVFLRAFSALVLCMVLDMNLRYELGLMENRATFLSKERVLLWYDSSLHSLAGERDFRGFTEDAGWAHSLAHMADALCHFARCKHLDGPQLERMLTTIADSLIRPTDTVFEFGEDTRLARAVYHALLRNEISADFLQTWTRKLAQTEDGRNWGAVSGLENCERNGVTARLNVRVFLRSLYFLLKLGLRGAPDAEAQGDPYYEYFEQPVRVRETLMDDIIEALRLMNRPLYRTDGPVE